jgi:hypothetical protein
MPRLSIDKNPKNGCDRLLEPFREITVDDKREMYTWDPGKSPVNTTAGLRLQVACITNVKVFHDLRLSDRFFD